MLNGKSYKTKLFVNILAVFLLTITVVTAFQYHREKKYRKSLVENTLNTINEITNQFIKNYHILRRGNLSMLDSLQELIPRKGIRTTVINRKGTVLYDSFVKNYKAMENHLHRPEIQESLRRDHGASIRRSATTGEKFYYYARNYGDYFIRTAALYDVGLIHFLKTDHLFIYFTLLMFIVTFAVLFYLTDRVGVSISRLKDFAVKAGNNEPIDPSLKFPKNELGIISQQIIQIYDNLRKTKDELIAEREKLFRHLMIIEEGVAVFSAAKKKILTNQHFVQFINIISEHPGVLPEDIFHLEAFGEINEFIDNYLEDLVTGEQQRHWTLHQSGRYFSVQCVFFQDKSFEILMKDITKQEKNRLIKQQMISNLAHELKTPLTSIRGYLETLLNNERMDPETRDHFIKRAFKQTKRLTALLNDISMLNKIGEAEEFFSIKEVKVLRVIRNAVENQQLRLSEKNIRVSVHVDKNTVITGNADLVYSVFQNLLENTILYAGKDVQVEITRYLEDENYYYFSYADTGVGIPQEHQSRIFERFYRVDKGRSRREGGTGLGLSIVKNAVLFHKGEITVRNRPGGGVEFLFTLAKNKK